MKKMIILALIATATITGCKKECGQWYEPEGKNCTDMRNKFYGTYLGVTVFDGQFTNTSTTLTANNDEGVINWDSDLVLKLTGSTTVEIPLQHTTTNGTDIYVEGTGSLNENQLVLTFNTTINNQVFATTFSGTKQ